MDPRTLLHILNWIIYVKKGTMKVLSCILHTLGEALFITYSAATSWFQILDIIYWAPFLEDQKLSFLNFDSIYI